MPAIIAFITKNLEPIAIALVLLIVFQAGNYKGYSEEKAAWQAADAARKISDDQALLAAQGSVITIERRNALITSEVSNGYESKIRAISDAYAGMLDGLQSTPAGIHTDHLSAVSDTAGGYNAGTCTNGLSNATKANLVKSARNAEIQTARLVACQAWIAGQAPPAH